MDLEVLIPAVVSCPQRTAAVVRMLQQLGEQCPGVPVHIVPQHRPAPDKVAAFAAIREGLRGLSRPWLLYLEDDVQLCTDFGPRLLDLVARQQLPEVHALFTPGRRIPGLHLVQLNDRNKLFLYAQVVLLPNFVAEAWRDYLTRGWQEAHPQWAGGPDIALGEACRSLGIPIFRHSPSWAQHLKIPSALGHTHHVRAATFRESRHGKENCYTSS